MRGCLEKSISRIALGRDAMMKLYMITYRCMTLRKIEREIIETIEMRSKAVLPQSTRQTGVTSEVSHGALHADGGELVVLGLGLLHHAVQRADHRHVLAHARAAVGLTEGVGTPLRQFPLALERHSEGFLVKPVGLEGEVEAHDAEVADSNQLHPVLGVLHEAEREGD
ncbi:hypothetical protein LAZ67_X000631 [Cordylochernes scorpioides]|uniref:Uncharacterized protein n=1 Tax=Cordylochernes scorpioides TaxID=51811 RepID=A0ABY6LUC1_9ARAC|nr:hypothetical protein LAZ67_X000631 [Cordylochernes scorpioides]